MKILYYIPQLYRMGGIERTTTVKANWLVQNGHQVILFLPEQAGKEVYYELDPRVKLYPMDTKPLGKRNIFQRLIDKQRAYKRLYKALSQIIKVEQPDIAICTDAEKYPILPIIMDKGRTLVEFHTSREVADYGTPLKEKLMGYNRVTRFIAHKLRIGGGWNRIAWHYYGKLIVLTQRDKNYWQKILGVKNIVAIPNPLPFTNPRQSSCTNKIVLAIGRFCDQKNFSDLLEIWSITANNISGWTLKLVGDGEYKETLISQINHLKLNGSIQIEPATLDIEPHYSEASIFCMTSKFEGFPMTLLEAQATGLPIVSYNCPCGPSEIVEDGVTGYIVVPGNKEDFANKLIYLMQQDELRKEMGRKAYKASHRYQIHKIMNTWINLFNDICSTAEDK